MEPKIAVLLIMARDKRQSLLEKLGTSGVNILAACDCAEASRILKTRSPIHVVLTDSTLPDGDWGNVLDMAKPGGRGPEVIVCDRLGEVELWIEALERGAYDLLVEPYEKREVRRILEGAAARSYTRSMLPGRELGDKTKPARAAGTA